jgi:hypothetical protein
MLSAMNVMRSQDDRLCTGENNEYSKLERFTFGIQRRVGWLTYIRTKRIEQRMSAESTHDSYIGPNKFWTMTGSPIFMIQGWKVSLMIKKYMFSQSHQVSWRMEVKSNTVSFKSASKERGDMLNSRGPDSYD